MRVFVFTLGCKVNTYESEAMCRLLEASGSYERTDSVGDADVILVNSCMVTEESEKKAGKFIRRARRENPSAVIAVTGCMAQISPEKAEKMGADVITGNTSRSLVPELLKEYFSDPERKRISRVSPHVLHEPFEELAPDRYRNLTRANLKIEDGCDCYCSYCIIPYARGHVRSMSPEKIGEVAGELCLSGHREIVLTGINIGMYGRDNGKTLYDAALAVHLAGADRIRLGSLEIDLLEDETLRKLAEIPGFCPHFHTSLQSGSDTVLARMHRKYTAAEYAARVEKIRRYFSDPSVTTDVIVGFPGETEEEFRETLDFVDRIGFYRVHVFPYSRREGTVAARMDDQVPEEEKKRRAAVLGRKAGELTARFLKAQVGSVQNVLFETCENGTWGGHTPNYVYVNVKSGENLRNTFRDVRITGFTDKGEALGELI